MTDDKTCAKCGCEELLKIDTKVSIYGEGSSIQLADHVAGAVPVSRLVCAACGFIEWWVTDAEILAKLKSAYGGEAT